LIKKLNIRHFITPGITGYAQINGYRGETRTPEHMAERVRHDVIYIENWSLFLDLKIIALTVWSMIRGDEKAY
jgi:putative colanic acid biosynthesis UDP-glucose lipid carrier transferase